MRKPIAGGIDKGNRILWWIRYAVIYEIEDFIWKIPMHFNYWRTRTYHKYWYNPIFYRNPNDPKGWFYRLMLRIYGYKEAK